MKKKKEKKHLKKKEEEKKIAKYGLLEKYSIEVDGAKVEIEIKKENSIIYNLRVPEIGIATASLLNEIRNELVSVTTISMKEITDPGAFNDIKKRFIQEANNLLKEKLPTIQPEMQKFLIGKLMQDMLGLGEIEFLVNDPNLEEVVIPTSKEPIKVYHKKYGWLSSNLRIGREDEIINYSNIIARRVGRQITVLTPLLDAHLVTGDRVNAILYPICTKGNTITIRKFRREPWTIIHFIDPSQKTMTKEIAALLWLCMQFELNILVAGGTASGKTSILNALMPFIPPNHRILSIEDTRELRLPDFLHWVPLTTREPNPEGKGEVSMLDLLVNSLRMRPDRIVVGEIRRQREAEVLFEAMHTGHSVYATLHADRAEQVLRRLTNPPIDVPESMLESLHLVIVQYRHRRLGIRRTLEVAEFIPGEAGKFGSRLEILYRWKPSTDTIERARSSIRLINEIRLHTGMTDEQMEADLKEKEAILQWMLDNNVRTVNTVGKVVAEYYHDKDKVLKIVKIKGKPEEIIGNLIDELKTAV